MEIVSQNAVLRPYIMGAEKNYRISLKNGTKRCFETLYYGSWKKILRISRKKCPKMPFWRGILWMNKKIYIKENENVHYT